MPLSPENRQACLAAGRPAVFLDRDGVINRERGYVCRAADFELIDGVLEAVRQIQDRGFTLVVVTNQSGIGRGYYDEAAYQEVDRAMRERFLAAGLPLAAVYYCPHAPAANCDCRKPAPGMLLRAQREHDIDLSRSWMVGDKESDLEAAHRAGVPQRVLVRSGHALPSHSVFATHIRDSLADVPSLLEVMR